MRSRSAIEFQDIVAATFVVGTDLIESDFVDVQEAVNNLPDIGGSIYLLQATHYLSATITLPDKSVSIVGCGNGLAIFDLSSNVIAAFTYSHTSSSSKSLSFSYFDINGQGVDGQIGFSVNDPNFWANFNSFSLSLYNLKYGVYDFSGASWLFVETYIFVADLVGAVHYKCDTANLAPFLFIANCSWLGVNGLIKAGGIDGGAFVYATTSRFDCGTVMNLGQVNISACRFASDGAPNGTVQVGDSRGVVISTTEFRGGAYLSIIKFVTVGPFAVTGCTFRASPTRAIDVSADMTGGSISGCDFTYTSEAIRIAGSGIVVSGNKNCKVTETGAADSNTYTGNSGMTGSTILGVNSKVLGATLSQYSAVTTNAFVSMMSIANPKGLQGDGTVENKGANSIDVKELFTDASGTSVTATTSVPAGDRMLLRLDITSGLCQPPYVTYEVQVKDTVNGSHGLPELFFTSQGAL